MDRRLSTGDWRRIDTDAGHFLIAWRIGTRDFWKVSAIENSSGAFSGGPSFAGLSPWVSP